MDLDLTKGGSADPSAEFRHSTFGGLFVVVASFGLVVFVVVIQSVVEALIPPIGLDAFARQSVLQQNAISGVAWLVAPLVAGAAFPRQRFAAYAGVILAAVAFRILDASRAGLPQTEMSGFGDVIGNATLIVYALIAALLILVGSQLMRTVANRQSPGARTVRALKWVALGGVVAFVATLALSVSVPDARSFAVELPPEWHLLPYYGSDPTYGTDFTAMPRPIPSVIQSTDLPSYYQPPTIPVVGVSVRSVSRLGSPADCFGAFDPWPGNQMLYQTEPIRVGDTSLPIGLAYEWIGRREGLTFYSYSFGRERRLLFQQRQLCYMVVVTVPETATFSESEARAIAETLRFR